MYGSLKAILFWSLKTQTEQIIQILLHVFTFFFSSLPPPRASKEALVVKNLPACRYRRIKRLSLDPWVGKIPWNRKWQPTPGFLPGESHGQRSLVGYSPQGCRELNTTDLVAQSEHAHTPSPTPILVFIWREITTELLNFGAHSRHDHNLPASSDTFRGNQASWMPACAWEINTLIGKMETIKWNHQRSVWETD